LSGSLENDLQGSRAEIYHLRAKLQLCGATIARLKSDKVLLQEAAMQPKQRIMDRRTPVLSLVNLSQLKSVLHTKASQLSSASTSLRQYKRMCSEMKTTEKELVIFIEDIIVRADATFTALLSRGTSSFYSVRGVHRWPHWQGSENRATEAILSLG
jgi:hypothetical protein